MRIAWLTDIHLNFVEVAVRDEFIRSIRRDHQADAVILTGDVGEAPSVGDFLKLLSDGIDLPIYFVLGNHDFYFSSIEETSQRIEQQCKETKGLFYLSRSAPISLHPQTALIGHDGWADGRFGDFEQSSVFLNDYRLIFELAAIDKQTRWAEMQRLATEAADFVGQNLLAALERHRHVIIATHVPAFEEACWHEGRISDDDWIPHFASKTMGSRILEIMADYPDHQVTILCGHTHGAGVTRIAKNVLSMTGGAIYGQPEVSTVLGIEKTGAVVTEQY